MVPLTSYHASRYVMSTDAMEEIAKAKREGMMPDHLVQTSSSSMQKKPELFYEHLLSEHWLASALYKKIRTGSVPK